MRTARLELRLTPDEKEQVDRLRDETGVPTSVFVLRLIKAALPDDGKRKPKAKPRRDKLAG